MESGYMISTSKSAYHDNCIPKNKHPTAPAASTKNYSEGDFRNCDNVTQDTIWKQNVASEQRCRHTWEDNWGFMTEYDARGELKKKEELPENLTVFSNEVPNTNSGNYGNRLSSNLGISMQQLEYKFYSENRRKRKEELVCY